MISAIVGLGRFLGLIWLFAGVAIVGAAIGFIGTAEGAEIILTILLGLLVSLSGTILFGLAWRAS